jgi:hypothetical protein
MVWKQRFVTLGALCLCSSVVWAQERGTQRPQPTTGNAVRAPQKSTAAATAATADNRSTSEERAEYFAQQKALMAERAAAERLRNVARLQAVVAAGGLDPVEGGTCGDCQVATGVPGCSDDVCEGIVCAVDPFCCDTAWDSICAGEATSLCDCGGGGGGDNDNCADRIDALDGDTAFSTIGATTDGPDDPTCNEGFPSNNNQDIWYNYTASCTGTVTVSLCGSGFDTKLTVYDGCTCPAVVAATLACNDDFCGLQSQVTFSATQGNCYKIRVGGFGAATGAGTMNISCGGGGGGGCGDCESPNPNGLPGCSDDTCEAIVCAVDAFCCNTAWDSICAGEATDLCDCGGGGGGCGDCEVPNPNGLPGCSDDTCEAIVCAVDSFCCATAWDTICAGEATDLCDCGGGGGDCGDCESPNPNGLPGCSDDTCEAIVCAVDPFCCDTAWDTICAGEASDLCDCGGVGGPCDGSANDCCVPSPNGTPGCNQPDCCNAICAADPFCCDTAWDGLCSGAALTNPACVCVGPECPPSANSCCAPSPDGTPGCDNPDCCAAICAADPFCCDVAWDGLCSGAAFANPLCMCLGECEPPLTCPEGGIPEGEENCGLPDTFNGGCNSPAPGGSNCCIAHGGLGCDDQACQDTVCAVDSFCCATAWDGICAGEAAMLCGDLCSSISFLTSPIECGQTVCGTGAAAGGMRDTDWYEFTLPSTHMVTWSVTAEFPAALFLLNDACAPAVLASTVTAPCANGSVTALVGAGTYRAFAAPNVFDGVPCPTDYVGTLTCVPVAAPSNDLCEDREQACDGQTPFSTIGAGTDGPGEVGCPIMGQDIWYNYTASCDGIAIISTCGSGFDTQIAVYDGCDCPASSDNQLACNDDSCGLQSQVQVNLVAGQCYKIRVGGFGVASGDGTLNINCIGACIPDCPDGAFDEGAFDPLCGLAPPGGSNCCVANGGLGCDNQACQDAVCAIDSFCCATAWDGICAGEAAMLCPDICNTMPDPDGGCNATPNGFAPIACGDTACGTGGAVGGTRDTDWYELVLESAQEITWQVTAEFPSLAGIIASPCPATAFLQSATAGPCATASVTRCLDAGTWYLFAAPNTFDGVTCGSAYVATLSCSGEPCDAPSNCCSPNGGIGCDDQACQDAVCAADSFCCATAWDQLCANAALMICEVCMGGPGGASNCCTANGGLGCDCQTCQDIVCAVDSFCCATAWDAICAGEAQSLCGDLCSGGECAPPPAPVTITSANPPDGHLDSLQNVTADIAQTPQGIGGAGTPAEGPVQYSPIHVEFDATPNPEPNPCNVVVECTDDFPPAGGCPTVVSVTATEGVGAGYDIVLSGPIPTRECTTITFLGTVPGENLQYRFLPGDYNLNGTTNTQDLLDLVQALNNGASANPNNRARWDGNRNNLVNTQDLLRCVQLLNGALTTEVWNQKTVTACP